MLRYTKALSLALLISIPAIAMENPLQHPGALMGPQTQEEAIASNLEATLSLTESYKLQQADLAKLVEEKQKIEDKATAVRENRNQVLDKLLQRRDTKQQSIPGVEATLKAVQQKLIDLQKEKEKKAAELATEYETKAAELKKQEDKAAADKVLLEKELKEINDLIDADTKKTDTKTAEKKSGWLGWLF